jgi:hypothetical protein
MSLNIEIGYTSDTIGSYKVDSDFPFSLSKSDKRISSGTPRQYLRGNEHFNNEQHNVKIRTTNGNVYIREI